MHNDIKQPQDVLTVLEKLRSDLDDDSLSLSGSSLPAKVIIRFRRLQKRVDDAILLIQNDLQG